MRLLSSSGYSEEFPISVAESYGQTLAIASASSPPYPSDDAVAMADISNFKTTKIMDKRLGPSRVEYNCEFEQLWLTIDLVEKALMGRCYEHGLIRKGRCRTLKERKRSFRECKCAKLTTSSLCSATIETDHLFSCTVQLTQQYLSLFQSWNGLRLVSATHCRSKPKRTYEDEKERANSRLDHQPAAVPPAQTDSTMAFADGKSRLWFCLFESLPQSLVFKDCG